jgi:signal transduction histidine kinase/HAMP domain-containing protein
MRWWLALAFAAIGGVTAVVVATASPRQAEHALLANANDIAVGKAVGAAFAIEKAMRRGDLAHSLPLIAQRRGLELFVFDQRGTLLSSPRTQGVAWNAIPSHGRALARALADHRFVDTTDRGRAVLIGLPLRHAGQASALVAFAPRPAAYTTSIAIFHREVVRAALWAALAAAAVGVLAAVLIARRLRRIAAAAEAIEQGDFATRVRPRFRDEVGTLAATIDRMRRRLAESFESLRRESDRLERLLGRLHEGVITVTDDLTIDFANTAAGQLLSSARPARGTPLPDPWPDFSLPEFARRLFQPGAPTSEDRLALEDGTCYELVGLPPPRHGGDGDVAVIVVADVTERERRERAEREFVTNAAHELRTPLSTITSAVELLESGAKDVPADRDRFLGHIREEAARLNRLTHSLLALARAQTQAEKLRLEPVEVRGLLEDALESSTMPTGVELELDCQPDVFAMTEPDLAAHIVANLAANAAKHTRHGYIRLGATRVDGHVLIEVADSGEGMPAAVRRRAFERFYRGRDRSEDGFGLGLAIVRDAARAVGGEIEIESALGRGTTVRVKLPIAARAVGSVSSEASRTPGGGRTGSQS